MWWVVLWPLALAHFLLSALGGDSAKRAALEEDFPPPFVIPAIFTLLLWAIVAAKIAGLT